MESAQYFIANINLGHKYIQICHTVFCYHIFDSVEVGRCNSLLCNIWNTKNSSMQKYNIPKVDYYTFPSFNDFTAIKNEYKGFAQIKNKVSSYMSKFLFLGSKRS